MNQGGKRKGDKGGRQPAGVTSDREEGGEDGESKDTAGGVGEAEGMTPFTDTRTRGGEIGKQDGNRRRERGENEEIEMEVCKIIINERKRQER